MARESAGALGGVAFTVLLVGLVAAAVADVASVFFLVLVGSVGAAAAAILWLFPGSRLFSVAFANLIAVYACLFVFFVDANFEPVRPVVRLIGFVLPILGFLAGSWLRREDIRGLLRARRVQSERSLVRALAWLVPVFGIGALTFALPVLGPGQLLYDGAFLASMAAIALIVLAVSPDVARFFVDTGLLFEEFFGRVEHLLIPAFAFLTFYSLQVIVFASLYRIIDFYSPDGHFIIHGQVRTITFAESLYFSLVTVSTVGYGDILPSSDLVRVLAALQIVGGVLLLLFGFSEIIAYHRERRDRG
jgi:voltage-gated potassium channel